MTVSPRPVQQPCPIWIAANPFPPNIDKPLERVAMIADGWMSVQLFPKMFASSWANVSEFLRKHGKDPANFRTSRTTT